MPAKEKASELEDGQPRPLPTDRIPKLQAKEHEALGLSLQAHYRSLVEAPIPDRFLVLLAELEAKESDNEK